MSGIKLADLKALIVSLEKAQAKSTKAAEARGRLPIGSTRARVTTANAIWANAAEARDRVAERLERAIEQAHQFGVVSR